MKRLALIPLLLAGLNVHAATIPYDNQFALGGDAFPNATAGQWAISSGAFVNTVNMPDNNSVGSTSSLQLTNATSSFTITTQFSVPSTSDVSSTSFRVIGLGFLGSNATFSGTNYLAQYVFAAGASSPSFPKGALLLTNPGDSATGFSTTAGSAIASGASGVGAIVFGTTYTLQLTVNLSAGQAAMTLGLYDASGTTQIGTSATALDATALTGTYFGYSNRYKTGGTAGPTQIVNFNDYEVAAVPEPHTLALSLLALAAVVAFRKLPRRAIV